MRRVFLLGLFLTTAYLAYGDCTVNDILIGQPREVVLSKLKSIGCKLQLNAPQGAYEDDMVLLNGMGGDKYSYHELIFKDNKLGAVWSYTAWLTSAAQVFDDFYSELIIYSDPVHPGGAMEKAADIMGKRKVNSTETTLQRPITEQAGQRMVRVEVRNGTIGIEEGKPLGDGTKPVRVFVLRNE